QLRKPAQPYGRCGASPDGDDAPQRDVAAIYGNLPEPEPPAEESRSGPYWTRPLAWDDQGRLVYLTTLCASGAVQDYQLSRWAGAGRSELLAAGQTLGGIGQAAMVGGSLAYVLNENPPEGPRGPMALSPRGPVALWLWDLDGGARGALLTAERGLGALAP
ncbi:MAG TPA: hypothetical protein PKD53_23310, partial [Chloroflexaceae bacterium]|nr:hypothetical protein [Chloroflexaceae bacterium]